jgi:hypothetical protein
MPTKLSTQKENKKEKANGDRNKGWKWWIRAQIIEKKKGNEAEQGKETYFRIHSREEKGSLAREQSKPEYRLYLCVNSSQKHENFHETWKRLSLFICIPLSLLQWDFSMLLAMPTQILSS